MSNRSFMTLVLVAALLGGVSVHGVSDFELPYIEFQPRQYYCRPAEDQVTVDGLLTERAWTKAEVSGEFVDITGAALAQPDFSTRVRMTYDDVYFYVAAEMEEPHVWATLTRRDAVIYHDNDFEVFIDPDGDTHQYYELEINALGTEWDLLLVRPYRDGGPAIHAWDIPGLRTAVHVNGSLNDPADVDIGWSVEIAIPWNALAEATNAQVPPRPGDRWRMNFSRVDWPVEIRDGQTVKTVDPASGKAGPEDNWVWTPQGLVAMHYPEMWGIVQFADTAGVNAGEMAARTVAERAAWELRRVYYAQREHRARTGRFADTPGELGVESPRDPGAIPWPPGIAATPGGFEAWLDLADGRSIRIDHEGRVTVSP
jgi:hypothetical protein